MFIKGGQNMIKQTILLISISMNVVLFNNLFAQDNKTQTTKTSKDVTTIQNSDTSITCVQANHIRKIKLLVEDDVTKLPCKIVYIKETEAPNNPQTLWSAQNDYSYCEKKFIEFKAKLEGWGWVCK